MKQITTKADETPEFRMFWEEVWRPIMNHFDGRGDARKAFLNHVRQGADPEDIVAGARWFARNGGNTGVDRDGKPVRIHAATWINKCAYEDGAERERAFQQHTQAKSENVVQMRPAPVSRSKWALEYEAKKAAEAKQEQKKA